MRIANAAEVFVRGRVACESYILPAIGISWSFQSQIAGHRMGQWRLQAMVGDALSGDGTIVADSQVVRRGIAWLIPSAANSEIQSGQPFVASSAK